MLDIYSSSSNLGDNLSITSLAAITPCRVHMFDDPCCRSVAPIFDGLAEVVFDNGFPGGPSPRSSDVPGMLPASVRLLKEHGLSGMEPIPKIYLTPMEVTAGYEFIRQFRNPCVLKCNPQELNSRTPPRELIEQIVQANPHITFLNFGLSKAHAKSESAHVSIKGVQDVMDLPIRRQAAIYHAIGRYLGPDTGDYHLMLAVGGTCEVLVPPNSWSYDYRQFHYADAHFCGDRVRVAYHPWSEPGVESRVFTLLAP